ncbi:PEP/pyruvate-binding domain-containing protein [Streptomyces sp. NPDC127178]|uniref:PEP/pyruvate-binding domain-containing protein n=1 Tax=unclassified Streptomyces TaxID=2593676 RepID=UPI0036451922
MLFVHADGGPPLGYALPRVAAHADVHVLALCELPDARLPHCLSVTQAGRPGGDDAEQSIVQRALAVACDAVLTLSEGAVVPVARACRRLGLPGPGPYLAQRQQPPMPVLLRRAQVPVPAFAEIGDDTDVREAFAALSPPLILKPAPGTGSPGPVIVRTLAEGLQTVRRSRLPRAKTREQVGEGSLGGDRPHPLVLQESVTQATQGWFDAPGWGGRVSVEGIVAEGVYHPLCISGSAPTVAPFTEPPSMMPVAVPEPSQQRIADTARQAVQALGLETCGTHTEIALGLDGAMWVLDTAARFGSNLVLRQAEETFGLDVIGMLVRQLLGEDVTYPQRILTNGNLATASLTIPPALTMRMGQRESEHDGTSANAWRRLVSPHSTLEKVPELPVYDDPSDTGGQQATEGATVCYLTAPDTQTLLKDCQQIMHAAGSSLPQTPSPPPSQAAPALDLPRFRRLCGITAGRPFVKIVVDRDRDEWHLLDSTQHALHLPYITQCIPGAADTADAIELGHSVYRDPERRFLLGTLTLHAKAADQDAEQRPFIVLETHETDTMGRELLIEFYRAVRTRLEDAVPLYLKPANPGQEAALSDVSPGDVPRIVWHQLYVDAGDAALNIGEVCGRLRYFATEQEYRRALDEGGLDWYDILAMPVIPEGVPRVAGLISGLPAAPLSHTNVLAANWNIPNAVVSDIADRVAADRLADAWVRYSVSVDGVRLAKTAQPAETGRPRPQRSVVIGAPHLDQRDVVPLSQLRAHDRSAYGTKAAHLGELHHVLRNGSALLTGRYAVPAAPLPHLLGYLAERLGAPADTGDAELAERAAAFLSENVTAPDGVAIPFAFQEQFLIGSWNIQQRIGKLKTALARDAFDDVDILCAELRILVRHTPLPDDLLQRLHDCVTGCLPGHDALVVRSSSNAEDLPGFSAAGLYESVDDVGDEARLADAVRQVWASLFSSRSVRLRHQEGISPADTYMGVVIHPLYEAAFGGVMVTCNPTQRDDVRHVSINVVPGSPQQVVEGSVLPWQYQYNTVEGGGRTVSLGNAVEGVDAHLERRLGHLALAGRLLQGHFDHDAAGAAPLDIEWLLDPADRLHVLQIRPYAV